MLSVKNILSKKIIILFSFLFFASLLVWAVIFKDKNYNPVETLKVEEATVNVYFSPEIGLHGSETYQGRIPDAQKHRFSEYNLILENTGKKKKNFVLVEMVDLPELTKLIFSPGTENGYLPRSEFPKSIPPGGKCPVFLYFLAEGDPAEIKKLASQIKFRILWEEGGKKWEKIVSVNITNLAELLKDYYSKEEKYEEGKTLELVEDGNEIPTNEIQVYVGFSSELNYPIFDWYKGKQPDPKRHRDVFYQISVKNTGKEIKRFVLFEPILDPFLQKLVINTFSEASVAFLMPDENWYLPAVYYLAEGDPAEIEKLASKTKLRILWTEGGKKWEKIVSVNSVKATPVISD